MCIICNTTGIIAVNFFGGLNFGEFYNNSPKFSSAKVFHYTVCVYIHTYIHTVDIATNKISVTMCNVYTLQIADFGMARDVADDTYYITSGGKIPLKWTALEVRILYK